MQHPASTVAIAAILWQRLDAAGHDACRLEHSDDGCRLDGTAVFSHDGEPASLAYQVWCDERWQTTRGSVVGWIGSRPVHRIVERSPDSRWMLNGVRMPEVDGCLDLDLGFTPATNLFQLRRLALPVGASTSTPVAWLDAGADTLDLLTQRYERRAEYTYWYESPRFDYAALLDVEPVGFVRDYPELWKKVNIG